MPALVLAERYSILPALMRTRTPDQHSPHSGYHQAKGYGTTSGLCGSVKPARADLKVGATAREHVGGPEVAQKNKGQTAYREQGHAGPDVEQKAGRAGVKQSVHQRGVAAWRYAGEHRKVIEEVTKVAGLDPVTAQNGALENIPVRAIGQVERDGGEQQTRRAG